MNTLWKSQNVSCILATSSIDPALLVGHRLSSTNMLPMTSPSVCVPSVVPRPPPPSLSPASPSCFSHTCSRVLSDLLLDITYPFPFIFFFTHCSQKFTNTTHFSGPPTDPCLTPLPCRNGRVFLPLPRATSVVAPSPSSEPESRFTIKSIMSCGIPIVLQLSSWDQYSIVSNALLRSATIMCSSCPDLLASSIISAMIRSGAATPPLGSAPNCPRSNTSCFISLPRTLPTIICSYIFMIFSIRAIGLTAFRSASPLSDLGSSLMRALFMQSGILFSSKQAFINANTCAFDPPDSALIAPIPTCDGPAAVPDFDLPIASSSSSLVILSLIPSHQPSLSPASLLAAIGSR